MQRYNDVIGHIIEEEVSAYYAGRSTPEQVADVIESRVNLYISEME